MKAYQKITIFTILLLLCFQQNTTAQDTLSVIKPAKAAFSADPQRATMLALTFPGFGQIYNRKYWKIPLVYAGFGGLAYAISYNSSLYNKYMKAYQDFTDDIPETDSYPPAGPHRYHSYSYFCSTTVLLGKDPVNNLVKGSVAANRYKSSEPIPYSIPRQFNGMTFGICKD